jgi:AhpD family alkylhydroperoxidase
MTTLERIDPALAAMNELAALCPDSAKAIQSLRRSAIFKDGVLPARHKALAATLWSISARCEPCVEFYAAESKRLGATKEELGEFLGVAATMGGCVGETWAVKALHAFISAGARDADEPACCVPAARQ